MIPQSCAHPPCPLVAPLRMLEVQRENLPPCFLFVPLCTRHADHLEDASGVGVLPEGCEAVTTPTHRMGEVG